MIDELIPNKVVKMTEGLHRMFNAGGCDPACHCCGTVLVVGSYFRLASITELDIARAKQKEVRLGSTFKVSKVFKHDKPHEVMLCSNTFCTPQRMIDNLKYEPYIKHAARTKAVPVRKYGCFIVDGKIV